MGIFDCMARADIGHKKRTDGIFGYLNKSGRPGSNVSRALIEEMFSRLPRDNQQEFRSRFRSDSNVEFASAFHELCLHDLLIKQACELIPHPSVPGSTKRPDFLVLEQEGLRFVLEATNSTAVSTGPSHSPRADRIRDFLEGFKPQGFSIGIDELVPGSRDLRRRSLVRHVADSLERISARGDGQVVIPAFMTRDGWKIRLTAIPNCSHRNGGLPYEAWSRTSDSPSGALSKALIEKARRYGSQLDSPFVIAINSFDAMISNSDFAAALFGEAGLWGTADNPRYGRVSAVLFTVSLWPETLLMGHVESRLYLNPFGHWPYIGVLTKLDTLQFEHGSWRCYPGVAIHRLLELALQHSRLWD